jgi:hypothetical protein
VAGELPLVVEEYIEGRHIDVNGMMVGGRFVPCGVVERWFCYGPYHVPIECLARYPEWNEHDWKGIKKACYKKTEEVCKQLGITNTPIKADLKWDGSCAHIIEMSPRFHGDIMTSVIAPMVGYPNPTKNWFAYCAGVSSGEYLVARDKERVANYAAWKAIFAKGAGVIDEISLNHASDVRVIMRKKIGDIVGPPRDNNALVGFFIASGAKSVDVLDRLIDASTKSIVKVK